MATAAPARLGGRTRLLYAGPFVTMLDRFSVAPLLIPIAHDFRVPLAQVTNIATLYFLLYGAMQVVYGLLSDRIGRVRLMRIVCVGVGLSGVVSALAPNLTVLLIGRTITGALICAIIPASLVYVGDTYPFQVRQQVIADLLAAVAAGTATATLGAGLLAAYLSWRIAFLVPALAAFVLSVALRWLPESLGSMSGQGPLTQLRTVLTQRWALFLMVFAIFEGAAILGLLTFFAPALEAHGQNAATAGLVVAAYGVAVLAGTQAVRRLAGRLRPYALIVAGGACLFAGYLLAALAQDIPALLAASTLAGLSYAVMHSTFQAWATEVAPNARGTATSLFVTSAFLGAGLATAAVSGLAGAGLYSSLFLIGALVTAPMVAVGAIARWRFPDQGLSQPHASISG